MFREAGAREHAIGVRGCQLVRLVPGAGAYAGTSLALILAGRGRRASGLGLPEFNAKLKESDIAPLVVRPCMPSGCARGAPGQGLP